MDSLVEFIGVILVVAGLLAFLHFRSVFMGVILCSGLLIVHIVSMGEARPIGVEWRELGEVEVHSYILHEPEAIYIWVLFERPVAYKLPWSLKMAKQLTGAEPSDGDRIVLRDGTDAASGFEIDVQPPAALPPKS